MKKMIPLISCLVGFLCAVQAQTIDPKTSHIKFEIGSVGGQVEGSMQGVEGTVQLNQFAATVSASTVNTNSKGRDKHLQKDDFFGVAQYPDIKLTSNSITKTEQGYEAQAALTIKDVTTDVVIPFTVEQQGERQILNGTLDLQRKDYDLGANTGKLMIGLDVRVFIHAEVVPAS